MILKCLFHQAARLLGEITNSRTREENWKDEVDTVYLKTRNEPKTLGAISRGKAIRRRLPWRTENIQASKGTQNVKLMAS